MINDDDINTTMTTTMMTKTTQLKKYMYIYQVYNKYFIYMVGTDNKFNIKDIYILFILEFTH